MGEKPMSFAKKHPSQPRGFFILDYSDRRNSNSSKQGLNGEQSRAVKRKTLAFCCP